MNKINLLKYMAGILLAGSLLIACEEGDDEKEYGFPLIYMPQTTIYSGGLDNNYPVPNSDELRPNYTINEASGEVKIILGVYRAGLQELESFSVEVYADVDTVNQIVGDSLVSNGTVLPADLYSFPSTVTVEDGEREATFYLTVDGASLNSNYPELAGSTLIVAIGIRNPTKYELNNALAKTIVLINADAFMPLPPPTLPLDEVPDTP